MSENHGAPPRGNHLTLRQRMVALSAVSVAVVLLLAGALLGVGLRRALVAGVIDAGRLHAHDLATLAGTGDLPATLATIGEDEALVQVVVGGVVIAASENVEGEGPVSSTAPAPGREVVAAVGALPIGEDDDFRLVSLGVQTPSGPGVVHVAVTMHEVNETVTTALGLGLASLPVLVLLLSAAMWVVVGRTLRPIEAIRREAEGIGADQLSRRVPEPPTDDEVGRLARTVNGMLGRIEQGAARQRQFVGDAAHELRTPIASLRAQLEAARASSRPVDWTEASDDLLAETLRMERLTEQLLLLARLDESALQLRAVPVDLDDVCAIVLAAVPVGSGIALDRTLAPVQIVGEPTLLGLLVRNLVENAVRHATGRVAIDLRREGAWALIWVEDDGPGIPEAAREEVFGRFRRLDEARVRPDGGAGLGLAIVADVAAAHGGTVVVVAGERGGARFEVRLPLGADQGV